MKKVRKPKKSDYSVLIGPDSLLDEFWEGEKKFLKQKEMEKKDLIKKIKEDTKAKQVKSLAGSMDGYISFRDIIGHKLDKKEEEELKGKYKGIPGKQTFTSWDSIDIYLGTQEAVDNILKQIQNESKTEILPEKGVSQAETKKDETNTESCNSNECVQSEEKEIKPELNDLVGKVYRPFTSSKPEYFVKIDAIDYPYLTYIHLDNNEIKSAKVKDFLDSYIQVADEIKEESESFSSCLSRNGINLEKDHHKFEVGTIIKDNMSQMSLKVVALNEDNISLDYVYAFGAPAMGGANIIIPYTQAIETFNTGGISIPGFDPSEKMEFARVLNSIQHCRKMDALQIENGKLKIENLKKDIGIPVIRNIENNLILNKLKPQPEFTNKATLTPGIEIGDEYMWHGGPRVVVGFDDMGNVDVEELDDNEKTGRLTTVSIESFLKEASKFPKIKTESAFEYTKKRIAKEGTDSKKAIEGLKVLFNLTSDKEEKKKIKAEIKKLSGK